MQKFTLSIFVLCSLYASSVFAQSHDALRLMDGYGNRITSTGNKLDVVVTGGGGDGAINDGVSSAIKATVFDFTNSNPLGVVLRDTNGDYVSVGGGTQYNQGTATTDTDTLSMMGCVRADTPAVATGVADGDRARCILDSTNRLWTHVGAIDGTVTVSDGSGAMNVIIDSMPTVTVTDGAGALNVIVDSGTLAATQSGVWNITNISGTVSLPTGAATSALQDGIVRDGTGDTTQANVSSGRLHVDGSGVTQPVSGTVTVTDGAGALNVIVDSGSITVSDGAGALNVIVDSLPTVTVTDGAGALNVIVDSGTLAATQSGAWNITNISGTISLPTGAATAANQDGIIRDGTGDTTQANVASGRLQVDGSGVTQPVSGTVTVTDGAGALNVIVDSGTITIGTFPDNEPINVAQMNGVAVTMGNGVSGTGVQRVTLASDSTGQVAIASLPNEGQQTMANSISVALASDQSSIGVTEQSSSAVVSGQQAVTASAVALPSNAAKEVCVKALVGNALNIYVGPSGVATTTGIELAPGDGYCTRVTNTNALFVVASSTGSSVSFAARN